MYALIVKDKVLIFDMNNHYGFHSINEVSLNGYLKVINLLDVIKYSWCFDDVNIYKVEPYSDFLFRVCLKYLKSL